MKSKYVEIIKKLVEDGVAPVATNAMGTSSSKAGTGPVDTYDPLLMKKRKLNTILRRRNPNG